MCIPFDAERPNLMWWHTWRGDLFLWGQPSPVPREQSHSAPQFWGSPLFVTTFSKVTHWRGAFLAVSHASHLKGMKPQRTQILGVPSSYFYTLRRRITEVGVVTHIGRLVHVSAGQARIACCTMRRAFCQR